MQTVNKEIESVQTDRQAYIDIARGILIICVVVGHIINFDYFVTGAIKSIIYSFHMPAFFIISGMLMKKEKLCAQSCLVFIVKRAKRLLIPYVIFEILGGLLQMLLLGTDEVNLIGILYGILTIHCHIGADWFLPTLFFAEILFFVTAKKIGREYLLIIGIVCVFSAMILSEPGYFVAVLRRILIAYGYIICGYIGKRFFSGKSILGLFLSGGLLVVLAYYNGVVDMAMRVFHNPVLYFVAGINGSYFIMNFSQFITGFLKKTLSTIGKESLVIMGTHQHIMLVANCLFGSRYNLKVQIVLLFMVLMYELLLVCLKNYRITKKVQKTKTIR